MQEEILKEKLNSIAEQFDEVIEELKAEKGIISTEILNIIDKINKLSVEI